MSDTPPGKGPRYQVVDLARGIAFVNMFAYHAAYFAQARGLAALGLGQDLRWRLYQKAIAGSFYLLVGVSLYLANRGGIKGAAWAVREGKLLGCALVVTLASVVLDPSSVVTYGILHNIAVCSALGLLCLRLGPALWLVALAAFVLPEIARSPALDDPWLRWLGLGTVVPRTFDHQPLLPHFGIVAAGIALGGPLAAREGLARWHSGALPARALSLMGRHSLFLYMAHVPVLVASVEIAWWLLHR